jgi:hypothetical protein
MKKLLLTAILFLHCNIAHAANVVTVLNTAVGENGSTQVMKDTFLDKDVPLRFVCDLSSGDTVKFQGKAASADTWVDVYSWTADEAKDIYPTAYWRIIRSTDGTVGESVCKVHNPNNQIITAHTS